MSSVEKIASLKMDANAPKDTARGTETILLAEDDGALRSLTTMSLESTGYTVIRGLWTGEDVVKKVLQNEDKVRLVLCIFIKPKRNE